MALEGLSDNLKGNEALTSFNSLDDLANAYISSRDFKAGLPDDLKSEKSLEAIKDIPGLAKSYVEAQKMIGGSVRVPKDDAPPEEWAKFYAKTGTPAKPEEYKFTRPALGEGVAWDEPFEREFLAMAHGVGLNNKQVQALMDMQAKHVEGQLRVLAEKRKLTVSALKQDWGEDFERRMTLAGRAKNLLQEKAGIKPEEADAFFDGRGAGDDPVLLKIFHAIGEIFAEDGWIKGETAASQAQTIRQQIDSILKDANDAYNKKDDPKHDERVEFVSNLYKRLYK